MWSWLMSLKMLSHRWDLSLKMNISLNGCEWKVWNDALLQDVSWHRMKFHCRHFGETIVRSLILSVVAVAWAVFGQPRCGCGSTLPLLSFFLISVFSPLALTGPGVVKTNVLLPLSQTGNLELNVIFYCCCFRNLEYMAIARKRKGWRYQYPTREYYHRWA